MAIPRNTRSVLVVAFIGTFSALAVSAGLARWAPRAMVAPEAWAALQRQDAGRAATLFRAALKERPRDPMLYFGAASAAYASRRPNEALSFLKTSVEIDPTFAEAQTVLARIAYETGDTALATQAIEKAHALRPEDTAVADLRSLWQRESSVHRSFVEKPAKHFRILVEGGTEQNVRDHVADVLERQYEAIGRTLNSYPPEPVTVVLYSNRDFREFSRTASWARGSYDGRIRVAVGNALQSPRELDRILTHELVHAIVAASAPGRVPAWVDEGLATYLDGSDRSWVSETLRNARGVVPLDALANGFGGFDAATAQVAYAESVIAAEILYDKLGPNIGAFLRVAGSGRSIDDALLAFQVQPTSFHFEWRRRVTER